MKPNIYIKGGFIMPENCHECPFAKWEYFWRTCIITKKTEKDSLAKTYKRPRSCPLVYEKEKEES